MSYNTIGSDPYLYIKPFLFLMTMNDFGSSTVLKSKDNVRFFANN